MHLTTHLTETDLHLTRFALDLASKQKPLPPEFQKVLYENLWNLYASSDGTETSTTPTCANT